MHSIDQNKRTTLISFAAAGVATAASVTGLKAATASSALQSSASFPLPATANPELDITIVNSSGVVENTVLLRNNTSDRLNVERFRAGNIVFDEKKVNLSSLTNNGAVTIEPNQSISYPVEVRPVGNDTEVEYLWAQRGAVQLENNSVVVALGGFMVGEDAVVFPVSATSVAAS